MMMIGGGVATPPGTAKSVAAIDSEMVQVDGIGSGSVSGSASGSGSPATGATTTRIANSNNVGGNNTNNNNNGDVANNNNNNNEGHAVVNCGSGPGAPLTDKFCCHDDDAPVSTGVARPWEPPSPTFSQTRSHLFQVHPPHHHQHPAAHHHQQMTVPPVSLIDGQFAHSTSFFLSFFLSFIPSFFLFSLFLSIFFETLDSSFLFRGKCLETRRVRSVSATRISRARETWERV